MATPEEHAAFAWMQGRMVELLLRHDLPRFTDTFAERVAAAFDDPQLDPYRWRAVLFYLRDELFDSILPRIKRRLSFAAPRELYTEALPTRGRIDWARTARASLRDRPGEAPLEVQTRQRRRHFATPENLLTIITLLEYRDDVQELLEQEADRDRPQALRHPLQAIVEGCTRELSFLQFAGLVPLCQRIRDGSDEPSVAALEAAVREHLLPGHNSAYDDLLAWREKRRTLRLLDRDAAVAVPPMLGSNPADDDYLYQCWIFYELVDLLQGRGHLEQLTLARGAMAAVYRWGDGDDQQRYRLQHDQGIPKHWLNAPGVRPDLYIQRVGRTELKSAAQLIWNESGYVLDAKYYRPRPSRHAPGNPVKRMVADLVLAGERHGALLFAFQQSSPAPSEPTAADDEPDLANAAPRPEPLYTVRPSATSMQTPMPDVHVDVWRTQPDPNGRALQEAIWQELFARVHQALKAPIALRCHGMFLDTLSANAHGALASTASLRWRDGQPLDRPLDDLLLCPKPHIGPWRVDLVSLSRDCCANPSLCHIVGQAGAQQPRRLTALDEITAAVRARHTDDDEVVAEEATEQVLTITRRYAQLLQPDIMHYRRWIRNELDIGERFDTSPLLGEAQREALALARFLWEQIELIRATNFTGPALLLTGVLEAVARATIYQRLPDLYDQRGRRLYQTLGTLGKSTGFGGNNYLLLERAIVQGGCWHTHIAPAQTLTFARWIELVREVADIRNHAAHQARVELGTFQRLTTLYFGSSLSGIGVLNGLLLAWNETH